MTKYIDADTLIKRVKDLPTWWADGGGYYGGAMKYPEGMFEPEDVISIIENAPAADVVEVVRCRECLCYTPVDDNIGKCVFLIGEHQYVVPDGYCYLEELKKRC